MTEEQAFEHLLDNWKSQGQEYKDKYKSYRSKFLKNGPVGEKKKREMLIEAGYSIKTVVKLPKRQK